MENKIIHQDKFINVKREHGFIYVVSNKAYPGLIKIEKGLTIPAVNSFNLDSKGGTNELLEYVQLVPHYIDVEAWIQREFEQYRDLSNRKFFRLKTDKAIELIENAIIEGQTIKYRTKIHAKWGMFFNILQVPFEYITTPIKLGPEVHYLPEFWLPEQNCWMIIRKKRFDNNNKRLMAFALSRHTNKVVFAFYDCKQGFEGDLYVNLTIGALNDHNMGQYVTPEGDRDGLIEWGICDQCGSINLGFAGIHELCYKHNANITPKEHPRLIEAFNLVNKE